MGVYVWTGISKHYVFYTGKELIITLTTEVLTSETSALCNFRECACKHQQISVRVSTEHPLSSLVQFSVYWTFCPEQQALQPEAILISREQAS